MSKKKHEWTRKGVTASMAVVMAFGMVPATSVTALATENVQQTGLAANTEETNPVDQSYAEGATITIDSNEDLVNAIKNQKDNQTWIFTRADTYNVFNEENYSSSKDGLSNTNKKIGGYVPENDIDAAHVGAEYVFPIYADNLTIEKGSGVEGDVVLTSTARADADFGGTWNYQNFITVASDNVTFDGVDILMNDNLYYVDTNNFNKAIELIGDAKNFTIKNSEIKPKTGETGSFSGSIYISVEQPKQITIENVTMYAWISGSKVETSGSVKIKNVIQDYRNNSAADVEYYGPGLVGDESTYDIDGFTVIADPVSCETFGLAQVLNGDMKSGTTYKFDAGEYNFGNPVTIDKEVSIVGSTNDVGKPATVFNGDPESTASVKALQIAGGDATKDEAISIKNVSFEDFGGKTTNGDVIQVGETSNLFEGSFELENCAISNQGKNGVTLRGGSADIKRVLFDVTNYEEVSGKTPNGLQVDYGADATLENCQFIDSASTHEDWVATGALILRGGSAKASGLEFRNCETGFYVDTYYNTDDFATDPAKSSISKSVFEGCGLAVAGGTEQSALIATHNYWGVSDAVEIEKLLSGNVKYDPYYKASSMLDSDLSDYTPPAPAPTPTPDEEVTTDENPDGSVTTTVTEEDGSSTLTTVSQDGYVTTVVEKDAEGNVTSIGAAVSQEAVDAAEGGAVPLPLAEPIVPAPSDKAPEIAVAAPAGARVAVPVACAEGSDGPAPGAVLVLVAEDGERALPKTGSLEGALAAEVPEGCTLKVVDLSADFPDVSEGDWFAGVADFASARNILTGVVLPDGTAEFQGGLGTTRAMFVTMLNRMEMEPEASEGAPSFADVDEGSWYAGTAAWAAEEGLLSGYSQPDGTALFGGDDPVTREQAAVFLMRYAEWLGLDTSARAESQAPDAAEVSSWAAEAVSWAVAEGYILGDEGTGAVRPSDGATRAEAAAIVMRFVNSLY